MALTNTRLAIVGGLVALLTLFGIIGLELHDNHADTQRRIDACHSIVNEVTRTSCINGWHGP